MTKEEIKIKILNLNRKRKRILEELVVPARAAANQMKDAGMNEGALALFKVIHDLDVLDIEFVELMRNQQTAEVLIDIMMGK